MIAVPAGMRVLVATRPIDFRKGADGLAALVSAALGQDPISGAVFVFRAKRADRVKILVGWHGPCAVLEAPGAGCIPVAAGHRWCDAIDVGATRRVGGRHGLVATACVRGDAADRDLVRAATD
jgi:hypothetical protein